MSRTVNGIQNCKKFRDNQFLHGVSKLGTLLSLVLHSPTFKILANCPVKLYQDNGIFCTFGTLYVIFKTNLKQQKTILQHIFKCFTFHFLQLISMKHLVFHITKLYPFLQHYIACHLYICVEKFSDVGNKNRKVKKGKKHFQSFHGTRLT